VKYESKITASVKCYINNYAPTLIFKMFRPLYQWYQYLNTA